MLDALQNDELRNIAIWRMQGYKNREIAEKLEVSTRTVERKLNRIRKLWQRSSGVNLDD